MTFLSGSDRQVLATRLASLGDPVTLLFFTQTFDAPDSCLTARLALDEIAASSDLVTVQEVNFILERDRAEACGISAVPAVVVLKGNTDTGMRFLGAPAGYEFAALVEAVELAGTSDSGLSAASKTLIARHGTKPIDIKVFVTPTCPHCPRAVTLANRMACESPLIHATSIEATEFLDLSRRYRVTGVPKIVVDDTTELLGALPEDEFVRAVLRPPASENPIL